MDDCSSMGGLAAPNNLRVRSRAMSMQQPTTPAEPAQTYRRTHSHQERRDMPAEIGGTSPDGHTWLGSASHMGSRQPSVQPGNAVPLSMTSSQQLPPGEAITAAEVRDRPGSRTSRSVSRRDSHLVASEPAPVATNPSGQVSRSPSQKGLPTGQGAFGREQAQGDAAVQLRQQLPSWSRQSSRSDGMSCMAEMGSPDRRMSLVTTVGGMRGGYGDPGWDREAGRGEDRWQERADHQPIRQWVEMQPSSAYRAVREPGCAAGHDGTAGLEAIQGMLDHLADLLRYD